MADKGFFCGNCGERLPIGSKFCPKCGADVSDYGNAMDDTPTPGYTQASAGAEAETRPNGSRSFLKWLIPVIVIVVVVILLIVFLISPGSVKLNKYMTFESSGADGFGTVTCEFDQEAFKWDYAGKIEMDGTDDIYNPGYDSSYPVEMLYDDCVDWNVTYPSNIVQNGALSNGDKIKVQWDCDDALAKNLFNKRLKYSTISYTVEGLVEAEGVDVFDYIDVTCSGKDSMGKADIIVSAEGTNRGISLDDFDLSPSEGLYNGEFITVSVNENALEKYVNEYGMVPIASEKVYTAEGLGENNTPDEEVITDTGQTEVTNKTEVIDNAGEVETDDYLCPYSSERLITSDDLSAIRASDYGSLPAGESLVQMIINEIYAKHGYKFSKPEVQAYFDQKPWYTAIGSYESDMDVVWNRLSSIEQQNVDNLSPLL